MPWTYAGGVFVLVFPPRLSLRLSYSLPSVALERVASLVLFAPFGRPRRPLRGQNMVASLVLFTPFGRPKSCLLFQVFGVVVLRGGVRGLRGTGLRVPAGQSL